MATNDSMGTRARADHPVPVMSETPVVPIVHLAALESAFRSGDPEAVVRVYVELSAEASALCDMAPALFENRLDEEFDWLALEVRTRLIERLDRRTTIARALSLLAGGFELPESMGDAAPLAAKLRRFPDGSGFRGSSAYKDAQRVLIEDARRSVHEAVEALGGGES